MIEYCFGSPIREQVQVAENKEGGSKNDSYGKG